MHIIKGRGKIGKPKLFVLGFLFLFLVPLVLLSAGCDEQATLQPEPAKPVSLSADFQTKPWPFCDGQEIITENYRIYTTAQRELLVARLPGFLQAGRQNAQHLTGLPAPDGQSPIYLLATRHQWDRLTRQIFPAGRSPADLLEYGGYTRDGVVVCWDISHRVTLPILAHEAMHQYLFGRWKTPIPMWVNEGLSVAAEGFTIRGDTVRFDPSNNIMRLGDLQRSITGNQWLGVAGLIGTTPRRQLRGGAVSGSAYYAQLYAMMSLIYQTPQYTDGLKRLLADAAAGTLALPAGDETNLKNPAAAIFKAYIAKDIATFDTQLRTHAAQLTKLK